MSGPPSAGLRPPLTRKRFLRLSAFERGYAVYMFGARKDVPSVPNENNPYPRRSKKHRDWDFGNWCAMTEVVDGEE